MKISFEFPGATPEQLARAVAVAWKFFDSNRVSPWACAVARFERDGWDEGGCRADEEPTAAQMRIARMWEEAEHIGLTVILGRPPARGESADMTVEKG
jgi:hypothetical protein